MNYYTGEKLALYANHLKLSEGMLLYIASRINSGEEISLMKLSRELQEKFDDEYVKSNMASGRPKVYSDVCLLCFSLKEAGHGRLLQVALDDTIYIGDIDR